MDAPPTRFCVDDEQPSTVQIFDVVLTNDALKPGAFVDHVNQEPVFIQSRSQSDGPSPVKYRVAHQLADQQLCPVNFIAIQLGAAQPGDQSACPRRSTCIPRQLDLKGPFHQFTLVPIVV